MDHERGRLDDPTGDDLATAARAVLEAAWRRPARGPGHCVPHPTVYPHLWLWDSCFHALAWLGLGDERCVEELEAVFVAQTPDGFVPHMRYGGPRGYARGPRADASSFTQPAVHGLVLDRLLAAGVAVPDPLVDASRRALRHLFATRRRGPDGLLAIVHPWESGADDSPRWDDWTGTTRWSRVHWSVIDQDLLRSTRFGGDIATGSTAFEVCPVAFDAIAVHSARLVAAHTGDTVLAAAAVECAGAIDAHLWNAAEALWDDHPVVAPRPASDPHASCHVPTLDGVLGALATDDPVRARTALDQVLAPDRFGARFGARYVPPAHPAYRPDAYWRGPAWPQLDALVWFAAHRWGRLDVAHEVAAMAARGAVASGFAEYWHPDTGAGCGAIPQSWATVAVALRDDLAPAPGLGPGRGVPAALIPAPPPATGAR